jgi:hypothetical protein
MELASCHPSGDWNFEVGPRFLEDLWTSGIEDAGTKIYFNLKE